MKFIMKELIQPNLNGRKVLLLFTLTNFIYAIMLMITIPKVMNFSGGMKLPDMIPTGYNAEYVNSLLNTLGDKGKDAYLFNQIPIMFGLFFINTIGNLFSNSEFEKIVFTPLTLSLSIFCL